MKMRDFRLSEEFLEKYKHKEPDWGELGEFVFMRTYSNYIESENRKEKWWETVRRVVEGCFNLQKKHVINLVLYWNDRKAQKSAKKMYDKIFNFKFLPPGRSLWKMGTPFIEKKGGACLNNCAFVTTEDIPIRGSFPFIWTMDMLMLGSGVGFDVKGANKIKIKKPVFVEEEFIIEDSREGWISSVRHIIDAFFEGSQLKQMNYNKIRPLGEPIKGFGGKAPGSVPLKQLHESLITLLAANIEENIKSSVIVDMMNMIAVAVVSGGVRRSSEIALGDSDDYEFINLKNFNSFPSELQSHRWSSNNSVFCKVGETDYHRLKDNIRVNGEPGLVWLENAKKYGRMKDGENREDVDVAGVNPCGEMFLESGEMCNLVETFPSRHSDLEEYIDTLKYAYMYAKTVSIIPTHWAETNAVLFKNRRMGISQSGIIDAIVKFGRREMLRWSDEGYEFLKKKDIQYSNWLCIPRSKTLTTVKPSGTVSLLPGVNPGIHYPHAEYYIRRVRVSATSELVDIMKDAGYNVEYDVYGADKNGRNKTMVIEFPVHCRDFIDKKANISIWEQVKNCVDYQYYWADNSVSITVTFSDDEIEQIPRVLAAFEDKLKAISFLPLIESGYKQMPYESISKEKYERMVSEITKPDFSRLTEIPKGERFCTGDTCSI